MDDIEQQGLVDGEPDGLRVARNPREPGDGVLLDPAGEIDEKTGKKKTKKKKKKTTKPDAMSSLTTDAAKPDMNRGPVPPTDGAPPTKPAAKKTKPKKKKEINPLFKDVQETGKWGTMNPREMYIVGGVVLLVVIAVIVVIVVVLSGGSSSESVLTTNAPTISPAPTPPGTPAPTPAPTPFPTFSGAPQQAQVDAILSAVTANQFVTEVLPPNDTSYQNEYSNTGASANVRAVSWMLYQDNFPNNPADPFFIERFVLVSLYYSFGGDTGVWTAGQDTWLSSTHVCDWEGVFCDRRRTVIQELDMSDFGLTGTIPPTINMLQDLVALWLRNNNLSGNPPFLEIGSIPNLVILYLNGNQLSGSVDGAVRTNGKLSECDKYRRPFWFFVQYGLWLGLT